VILPGNKKAFMLFNLTLPEPTLIAQQPVFYRQHHQRQRQAAYVLTF
jgi:hypothetical protein